MTGAAAQSDPSKPAETEKPAAQAEKKPAAPCERGPLRPKAGSASIAQPTGATLQSKQWQPVGGLIEIVIDDYKADADALVTTCFRWKIEPRKDKDGKDLFARFEESRPISLSLVNGKLKITVPVPDLPNALEGEKIIRRVWVVPLAEVRVIAFKDGADPQVDTWTEIGITHPLFSLALALGVLIFAFVGLNIVAKRRLSDYAGIQKANPFLRVISTSAGVASLSQFQILLWTFVVAGCTIYVATLSGQLVEITTGTLVLLGISGATTLAAQAQRENQIATKDAGAEKAATDAKAARDAANTARAAAADARAKSDQVPTEITLKAAADAAEATAADAEKKAKDAEEKAGNTSRIADANKSDRNRQPLWSDLIVNEDWEKGREIDIARVQMLLFTLVSAIFVSVKVIAAYVIPEIPVGYLALMGISNGVYVGSKVVRS